MVHGQTAVTGIVKDGSNGAPLSYVNIGILNKGEGTVSGKDGRFSIPLNEQHNGDTIRISYIGYQSQDYLVSDFRKHIVQQPEVILMPKSIQLPEIAISNKKRKLHILGNETSASGSNAGFTSKDLGTEMGLRLKIKRPTYLKTFHAIIQENNYGALKFRLNIYDIKNGKPGNIILNENIVIETSPRQTGPLVVDLTPYNLTYDDDVIVTLEWIEGVGDGRLFFSAKFLGSALLARETSQAVWERVNIVGIGFWIDAES